nr:ROK family transcriptional regulator [uncultured Novosphingobium sp.]
MSLVTRPRLLLSDAQRRVVQHLRIHGPTARVHLAQALDINAATLTRLTQQLAALGLIEENVASPVSVRGRPTIPVAISGHGGWSVGATLHPGWLELIVIDFRGEVLFADSQPFIENDPKAFARTLDERLRALAAERGFMHGRFLGLGVAVAGYALEGDRNRRKVVDWIAPWNDIPLQTVLGDVLDMPVWIENDAAAAALAEYYRPHIMSRHRSVLVFFLGHGVGGGLIAERDLFAGEFHNAGEVGRLFPGNHDRPSGINLLETLRRAGATVTSLADLEGLMDSHGPVFDAWIENAADQLTTAVQSGVVWLDPGAVIISGAIPKSVLERLAAGVEARCKVLHVGYHAPVPRIYASDLGSRAVVLGAALAPLHDVLGLQP